MDRKPMTLLLGDFCGTFNKANFNVTSLIEMTSHFVTTKQAPVSVSDSYLLCTNNEDVGNWLCFQSVKVKKTSFKICIVISFCKTSLPANLLSLASYLV